MKPSKRWQTNQPAHSPSAPPSSPSAPSASASSNSSSTGGQENGRAGTRENSPVDARRDRNRNHHRHRGEGRQEGHRPQAPKVDRNPPGHRSRRPHHLRRLRQTLNPWPSSNSTTPETPYNSPTRA